MIDNKGFTPVQIVIAIIAFFIFLLIVAIAAANEGGMGSTCSVQQTYKATRFTFYAGDCSTCPTGGLGAGNAFKENEFGIKVTGINVRHDSPSYAPKHPTYSKIFREVTTDPLLKADNKEPVFIEYKDPDFGWVKIVARTTATKIFKEQGTIINVIPKKGPEFKAIVADTGMTPAPDCKTSKQAEEACASLDLLMTTEDKDLNNTAIIPELRLKNSTIQILRYGPDGESSCDEASTGTGSATAISGECYRGSKVLNNSFRARDLKSNERKCLASLKINISNPKTPAAVVAVAEWILTKPEVEYTQAHRDFSPGWQENWGPIHYGAYSLNYGGDGLDCSGFVHWAYVTAGYTSNIPTYSGAFNSSPFVKVSSPQPGDVLAVASSGHVLLIVKVNSKTSVDTIEIGSVRQPIHKDKRVKLSYVSGNRVIRSGDSRIYNIMRHK